MINEKYQFHNFLKYKNVLHGVSSKAFGSMKNQDTQKIDREALAKFAQSVGITGDIVCMGQVHSGKVEIVQNTSEVRFLEKDGLITNKKHVPLAVLTADCLPVLLYDPKKEVIAAAHAGYRGLLNHILENTIKHFVTDFKSDSKDILVGIGPAIETMCYEVGEDRIDEFKNVFPSFHNMYKEKDAKFYLDLIAIARQCLAKEGILEENIEAMNICTKCDPNFYSYRGGDAGRLMSVISLV